MIHYLANQDDSETVCGLTLKGYFDKSGKWVDEPLTSHYSIFLVDCPKCREYLRTPLNKLPPQGNRMTVDKVRGQKIK